MGISLFWDDEDQTVILAEFSGRWVWDDLHAAMHTIQQLSQQRDEVFGAIIDIRAGLHVPGGTLLSRDNLTQFQQLMHMGSSGKGPMVIVGFNSLIRTIFSFVSSTNRHLADQVYFADTMSEARRTIYPVVQALRAPVPE